MFNVESSSVLIDLEREKKERIAVQYICSVGLGEL
jgi:hypothetical protein